MCSSATPTSASPACAGFQAGLVSRDHSQDRVPGMAQVLMDHVAMGTHGQQQRGACVARLGSPLRASRCRAACRQSCRDERLWIGRPSRVAVHVKAHRGAACGRPGAARRGRRAAARSACAPAPSTRPLRPAGRGLRAACSSPRYAKCAHAVHVGCGVHDERTGPDRLLGCIWATGLANQGKINPLSLVLFLV